ncbi:MAG: hypothetical protein A4E57_02319 [Syntrophorhabdaceae bacterium PtaU1.Bin034]|nr:MAG: hypothetical protein A4E57_02319 [Syntrophorhabdaceae bacterium PtaU1.Bin034]
MRRKFCFIVVSIVLCFSLPQYSAVFALENGSSHYPGSMEILQQACCLCPAHG